MGIIEKYTKVCKQLFTMASNFSNDISFSCVDMNLQDYVMYADSEEFYGTTPGEVFLSPGLIFYDFQFNQNRLSEVEFLLSGSNMSLAGNYILDNEIFIKFMTSDVNAEQCVVLSNSLIGNDTRFVRGKFLNELCNFFNGNRSAINGFGNVKVHSVLKYFGLSLPVEDSLFSRERFLGADFRKLENCNKNVGELVSNLGNTELNSSSEILILTDGRYEKYEVSYEQLDVIRSILNGQNIKVSENIQPNQNELNNRVVVQEEGVNRSDPFSNSSLF